MLMDVCSSPLSRVPFAFSRLRVVLSVPDPRRSCLFARVRVNASIMAQRIPLCMVLLRNPGKLEAPQPRRGTLVLQLKLLLFLPFFAWVLLAGSE